MLGFSKRADAKNILQALSKSQAVIEFDPAGNILTANSNFCNALGYELSEITGRHHRMFCENAYTQSGEYAQFWNDLRTGKFYAGEFRRIKKDGNEIWIEATYNPVFRSGKLYKVFKAASDITAKKLQATEDGSKLSAIYKSQAVIEFTPNGDILTANENFLNTFGYQLNEIVGRHQRMFCDPKHVASTEYSNLWSTLNNGMFVANLYNHFGKGGKEVWVQAVYNPVFNTDGRVVKVVQFATDVTPRMSSTHKLELALRSLAAGNLLGSLDEVFASGMEALRNDFNEVIIKLRSTMMTIGQNANGIANGSKEIRTASDQLSQRTEQQASSLEQSAAALEQITTTVSDSAKRADDAGKLVSRTKENAELSGEIVNRAISAMDSIARSSSEITNIIGVIDDIAFQTNLLALNAGVEAARAGEAGKGFAVVAQEVRELAQRSASAAKEIKQLINTSSQHVSSGVELVGQTGKALKNIVEQVTEINTNVTAIVESSREQANGLIEINSAINLMDQATQKNAAMVEETTAASYGLAQEADILKQLIGQFQYGETESAIYVKPQASAGASSTPPVHQLINRVKQAIPVSVGNTAASSNWSEF